MRAPAAARYTRSGDNRRRHGHSPKRINDNSCAKTESCQVISEVKFSAPLPTGCCSCAPYHADNSYQVKISHTSVLSITKTGWNYGDFVVDVVGYDSKSCFFFFSRLFWCCWGTHGRNSCVVLGNDIFSPSLCAFVVAVATGLCPRVQASWNGPGHTFRFETIARGVDPACIFS